MITIYLGTLHLIRELVPHSARASFITGSIDPDRWASAAVVVGESVAGM